MKNNLEQNNNNKLSWNHVQDSFKKNFGNELFESWLKKIEFVEEFNSYILLSVPTRFIRDWITSRYLDQILQIIKGFKKEIIRVELIIKTKKDTNLNVYNSENNKSETGNKISFLNNSYLQYNVIDKNKSFENFITGDSNKLAFEASKKVSRDIAHYNPLYIFGGVGMGKTHLLNAIGLELKKTNKVMFITAERFMYQFVKSIKANEMVKFKEYLEILTF